MWRLVTSAVVQGGGFYGTVSNLLGLAAVSLAGVAYWDAARTWVVFWFGAFASNIVVLTIRPVGGGNSMADFVVTTALTSSVLANPRRRRAAAPALAVGCAIVVLLSVAVVGATRNYHVWSCLIGLVIGLLRPFAGRADAAKCGSAIRSETARVMWPSSRQQIDFRRHL